MRRRSCSSIFRRPHSGVRDAAGDRDLLATAAYRYDLPKDLIAHRPAEPRDASRLLVVGPGDSLAHRAFTDFPSLLRAGDVLVVNETRVIRARLRGTREPGGGSAEVLLLRPADRTRYAADARRWLALVRPGRRLRPGARVLLGDGDAVVVGASGPGGVREVTLELQCSLEEALDAYGEMPLPPYVGPGDDARAARYQTIFARVPGSVAAPTASLHFTERTFDGLRARGVAVAPLVLDVGLGTFAPIASERIDAHAMHAEQFAIPEDTARAVNAARRDGRRVVAAGTTVVRALESAVDASGAVVPGEGETRLFVMPGFDFRAVDALLTNFHLPASTLLVLVCAFAGRDAIVRAYGEAVRERYRFYSFGDAMFLTRANGRP